MGASFTNIVLKGPSQDQVADALRVGQRSAFVGRTDQDRTVVFDEASESQGGALTELAQQLSARFKCPSLAVLVHDSDVLLMNLYQSGREVDGYNSAPTYFDESGDPEEPPEGGDSAALCAAFGGDAAALERVLRGGMNDYVFAEERLAEIVRILGLPAPVASVGFSYLSDAATSPVGDPDLDLDSFMRTP